MDIISFLLRVRHKDDVMANCFNLNYNPSLLFHFKSSTEKG